MPLVPLIWIGGIAVSALAGRSLLDGIGDTSDRVAPTLMMGAGAVALAAAGFIMWKGK